MRDFADDVGVNLGDGVRAVEQFGDLEGERRERERGADADAVVEQDAVAVRFGREFGSQPWGEWCPSVWSYSHSERWAKRGQAGGNAASGYRFVKSHTVMVSSAPADASRWPSGNTHKRVTPPSPVVNVRTRVRVATSHTFTQPFSPALST